MNNMLAGAPHRRPAQRATVWQVGEEPIQLHDGPRRIDPIKPLSELVHAEWCHFTCSVAGA